MNTTLIAVALIILIIASMTSMFRVRTDEDEPIYVQRNNVTNRRQLRSRSHSPPRRINQGPAFLRSIGFVVLASTLLILVMKLVVGA